MVVMKRRQSISIQEDGPKKSRKVPNKAALPVEKTTSETPNCPQLPKKPLQPKQLFINNKLDQVRNKPDFNKKKVIAEANLQWHGLSEKERQIWVDQASEEENKYVEKLKLFKAGNPDIKKSILRNIETIMKKRESKALRLAGLPKKPIPAKQMFVEERLEELEKEANFNIKKARTQANNQWDSLSDKEKQVWSKRAAEEGKKYIKMMKLFKADHPEVQISKPKTTLSTDGIKKGSAAKPPKSGYSLYFKTMLAKSEDLRSLSPDEQMKEILTRWNKMEESAKEKYRSKVQSEREKYKRNFAKLENTTTVSKKPLKKSKSKSKV